MFKFNKSKISRLFLTFFTLSLFNVSCMADGAVKIGEVSYVSEASEESSSPLGSSSKKVAINKGNQIKSGVLSSITEGTVLSQTNDGDMAVISSGSSSNSFLDGYILKGNVINHGENRHLVTYDSVPPLDCDLYVRAVKIKDGSGNDVAYDPNTSDTSLDSGWLKYEGRATFDHLAFTTGLWHTFAVRYKGEDFKNDYDVRYIVFDPSRSTDGINRYTLLDSNRNVVSPDVDESTASLASSESSTSVSSGSEDASN